MTLTMIFLLVLISLTSAWQNMPISMDSIEEGYQMIVNHDPWFDFETSNEDFGSSYQYYIPYYTHKKIQSSYNTRKKPAYNRPNLTFNRPNPTYNRPKPAYNRPKPAYNRPKPAYNNRPVRGHYPKPPPIQPTPPTQSGGGMSTREWPSWIPPVRFFKLPLDEPPAAIE